MIEKQVSLLEAQESLIHQSFIITQYFILSLQQPLQKLYSITKQQDRSMYGIKLYNKKADTFPKKGDQQMLLEKRQLSEKEKRYIIWCYYLLNWESISLMNFNILLQSLPVNENAFQQIRKEGNYLKIIKFNKALVYNIINRCIQFQDNQYCLQSYDKTGRSTCMKYQCGLSKIVVDKIPFRFNGLIRLIENSTKYMAVVTHTSIYVINIISLKLETQIACQNCIDLKWGKSGLYILQRSGNVGFLKRQSISSFSQAFFVLNSVYEVDEGFRNRYQPQRLIISNPQAEETNVYILGKSKLQQGSMGIKTVYHQLVGRARLDIQSFRLDEVGQILYKNVVHIDDKLKLLLISKQNEQERLHQLQIRIN